MMGEGGGGGDALDATVTIQTQANILQSDTLALQVIKDLHLERTKDFHPRFSPVGWALGLISPHGPPDPTNAPVEESPGYRSFLLGVFHGNLKVKPVAGTRIISISYLSADPKIAAAVVNRLAAGLADFNFQTRYNATSQAAAWLSGQMSDLRKESEDLQAKVVELQRDSGVFSLGVSDAQGREQVYSSVLDRLTQATAQLSSAEANRIVKGAVNEVVKTKNAEMISGLAGNSVVNMSAGSGAGLGLIQNLRIQQATLQGQVSELSAKFGPAYPKLAEMRSNLAAMDKAISDEVNRVAARAQSDYQVSQQVENAARTVFNQQKQAAGALNDKAIEYAIARQEADESRTLYESLLSKLKQAGVLAGLKSSNITIVDPARVPSRPAKPNVLMYLAASFAGGLFLGCVSALARDSMDSKIQDLPELEAYLGRTPFGILPYFKVPRRSLPERTASGDAKLIEAPAAGGHNVGPEFAVLNEPRSPYSEALRALRTSMLLAKGGAPPQVILITSSISAEGKSMLSLNLSALLAQQQGKRVLLIDGDLRRPVLHRRLNLQNTTGLSSILADTGIEETALTAVSPSNTVPGLDVLTAGPIPPYPAELLGSDQMRIALEIWRKNYDFIVIDGAPVLPVTDSVVLSTEADLTLLIARYKLTERQSLERSCRLLQSQAGAQKIGVVLNAVERKGSSYYEYYGYRDSTYYGSDEEYVKQ
jgi:capsular exopolysaccharide synthesis family protein